MILRLACAVEADKCYQFIEDAREYHRNLGFEQWRADYPTLQTIQKDIGDEIGFVFEDGEQLLGYCCIVIGDEPAYHVIDGTWKSDRPYAVVHRMAFGANSRGKGLSHTALQLIMEYCNQNHTFAIRIDTQGENKPMQHILEREGFEYCGLITFGGGPKLAYELDW